MTKEVHSVPIQFLKDEIRKTFGKEILYAADCLLLSEEILVKTKRQLSVSTLKRFFGIIKSPHSPSKYTLDTLIIYSQFENDRELINHIDSGEKVYSEHDPWSKIKKLTDEITQMSLNSIRNKIGPGFRTIPLRRFAERKMAHFMSSPKSATAFIAPDGMGKSTILAQITEKFFTGANANNPDDMVCLIDGVIFYNLLTKKQHFDGLTNLIEYNPLNRFNIFFFNNPELVRGKLVLIIEGIDDIFFVNGKTDNFIDNLLQIISSYEKKGWFKLVISCTPAIWRRFSDRIQKNQLLKSPWFDVSFSGTDDDVVNIPSLSKKEIKCILKRNHFGRTLADLRFRHPDIPGIIHNPYMLNLFLTNSVNRREIEDIDLLNDFVKINILSPPYPEEKFSIIKQFFVFCDKGKIGPEVNKDDLNLSATSKIAYLELVRTGILHEYSLTDKYLTLTTYVRFSHHILFAYYLANILIKESNLNSDLFKEVITGYANSPHLQCSILKYLIKILFSEEKTDLLKNIFSVLDSVEIKPDIYSLNNPCTILTNVIGIEMRKNEKMRNILVPYFAQSNAGRTLYFERFFDMDCLVLFSGNNLNHYLNYNLTEEAVQYVRYQKFMQHFLSGNQELCRDEYEKCLSQQFRLVTSSLKSSFYYIPQFIYQSVYEKKVDESLMNEVYNLSASFLENGTQSRTDIPHLEFAVLFSLNYGRMNKEILQLAAYVFENYDLTNLKALGFYQLFLAVYACALLETGEDQKAMEIYSQTKFKKGSIPDHMKYYVKIRQLLLQSEFLIYLGKSEKARRKLRKIKSISKMLQFHYFQHVALELEKSIVPTP